MSAHQNHLERINDAAWDRAGAIEHVADRLIAEGEADEIFWHLDAQTLKENISALAMADVLNARGDREKFIALQLLRIVRDMVEPRLMERAADEVSA